MRCVFTLLLLCWYALPVSGQKFSIEAIDARKYPDIEVFIAIQHDSIDTQQLTVYDNEHPVEYVIRQIGLPQNQELPVLRYLITFETGQKKRKNYFTIEYKGYQKHASFNVVKPPKQGNYIFFALVLLIILVTAILFFVVRNNRQNVSISMPSPLAKTNPHPNLVNTKSSSDTEHLSKTKDTAGRPVPYITVQMRHFSQTFFLDTATLTIGRNPASDIQLPDETISVDHAIISEIDSLFYVYDNNSTNGIFCNNRKVTQHQLQHGDVLRLGEAVIKYFET